MNATAIAARGDRRAGQATALLLLLGLVPAVAGTARLVDLVRGAEITEANARFFASPVPVVLHVLSVVPYSMLGAFQLHSGLRRRRLRWHRSAGRFLVVLGMTAALTGLWMTLVYPWPVGDGPVLYVLRLVFGSYMLVSLIVAVESIRRRDFRSHGAWMVRAYAVGMGAGTQVFTHAPWLLLLGQPTETIRAFLMGAGWMINLVVAEWLIRRRALHRDSASPSIPSAAAGVA